MQAMTVMLSETALYLALAKRKRSRAMAENLKELCEEAAQRVKGFYRLHPEFTLHDEVHFCRVVDLMGRVMGPSLKKLNDAEMAILILAAYWHDQGMVPDAEGLKALKQSAKYTLFRQNWELDHPNFAELGAALGRAAAHSARQVSIVERLKEMEQALLSDYIRLTHAHRSAELVREKIAPDLRARVRGSSLAEPLALLCESHIMEAQHLADAKRFSNERVIAPGVTVNEAYLAMVLRVADILDLDQERTPASLHRALGPTSTVSVAEWEKHRSVPGWVIGGGKTVFRFECTHPEYERTARRFIDLVDDELSAAHALMTAHPHWFPGLALDVPAKADRSQIGPKPLADGRAPYIYTDLEFSLSRDEIVRLVLADGMYWDPSACIRELLQNALDALRHRSALYAVEGAALGELGVRLEQYVNGDGVEVIRCVDNGVGMTREVIERFLTRVGRSYYRSPEFQRERARFWASNCDFDPCARFGIGFMSCFMLGDQIAVRTRRDFGPGRGHGEPLVVEIHGLSGMLVVRPGEDRQAVGTTVEIARRLGGVMAEGEDGQVDVVTAVARWALACEYPAKAVNSVTGEEGEDVKAAFDPVALGDQVSEDGLTRNFVVDLRQVDPNFRGALELTILADADGLPALCNAHARLKSSTMLDQGVFWDVQAIDGKPLEERWASERRLYGGTLDICCDGILVTKARDVPMPPDRCNQGHGFDLCDGRARGVFDFRGPLKPSLTPAREPTFGESYSERQHRPLDASWYRCGRLCLRGLGALWGKVLTAAGKSDTAHNAFLANMAQSENYLSVIPLGLLWEWLRLPILQEDGQVSWAHLNSLDELWLREMHPGGHASVYRPGGKALALSVPDGRGIYRRENFPYGLHRVALALGELFVGEEGFVRSRLGPPAKPERSAEMDRYGHWFAGRFDAAKLGVLADTAYLHFSGGVLNRDHAITRAASAAWEDPKPDAFGRFAKLLCDEISTSRTLELLSDPRHQVRRLGRLYEQVTWEEVSEEARPPYMISQGGRITWELTDELFRAWAMLPRDREVS